MTLDLPFRGSLAVASGAVTADRLRGPGFRRLAPDVYLAADVPLTLRRFLHGLMLWRPDGVVGGLAAAAVWCDADTAEATGAHPVAVHHGVGGLEIAAIDLVVPGRTRPPPGVRVRGDVLAPDEITECDGVRVTSPARTVFDLARRLPRDVAVVAGDAVARRCDMAVGDVQALIDPHAWERGVAQARRTIPWLEPGCRTPLVSRVRLALLDHGIAVPVVGGFVVEDGVLLGHPDLSWPALRCAVLCDEREAGLSVAVDEERLCVAGWSVCRVAPEWAEHPAALARTVDQRLRAARYRRRRRVAEGG